MLGFDSYTIFATWLIIAVSGNGLTLFAISRREWSRYWKLALATPAVVLVLSAIGVVGLWGSPMLKDRAGLGVAFVFGTHLLNLVTLVKVARLRKPS